MTRRISIARIVGLTIAGGLVAVAVCSAIVWWRRDREFLEWVHARPVRMSVDLSRPGRSTGLLKQTCAYSHGEALYLSLGTVDGTTPDPEILDELVAKVVITDQQGKDIIAQEIDHRIDASAKPGEPICLAYFHPFERGDYTFTLDVVRGAARLAGIQQTIFAKYELCGLERAPAILAGLLALVSGFPAGVMLLVLGRRLVRYGIWKR